MKFIISLLLTALLSFAAGLYLPWWSIAVCAFIVSALIFQQPFKAFLAGFAGVFLLWFIFSWSIDSSTSIFSRTKLPRYFPWAVFLFFDARYSFGWRTSGRAGSIVGKLSSVQYPQKMNKIVPVKTS